MTNKRMLGHFLAIISVFVWGITFISSKVVLTALDPVEIIVYRSILAYVCLVIIHPKFYKITSLRDELPFVLAGVSGVTLYFLAETTALTYTTASNTGVLVSTAPIFTILVAQIFSKNEKIKKSLLFGSLIAMFGTFLVIFNGHFTPQINPLGDLLAIFAAACWGFYSLALKKIGNENGNYIYITRKMFFYAILSLIPVSLLSNAEFHPIQLLDVKIIINMLFLSIMASSLCYVIWNYALSVIGIVRGTNYIYFIPVIAIGAAAIILGESITPMALIGSFLVLLGVYLSEHSR